MGWTCWKLSSLMASSKLLLQSEAKSGCCCLDDQGQEIWSEEEILLGWALGTAKKAKSISLTSEFCRDSHIIIFILRFHFRMRKWQELSRWKRFFAPQSLWMDPTTWPFFLFTARKYSSNGPTAIFHTFFLAERCRLLSGKDPLQKSTMTSIDGKIFWQMASLDSRQYVSHHVMSTYPLFGVMVERKDGRGSAQIVFG